MIIEGMILSAAAGIGLGFYIAKRNTLPDNSSYWQAISERNHRKFVDACKDANALEDELNNANASIARLTDALAAKNARLERIYEKGSVSKSGAAVHLAKIAMGDA